MGGGRKVGGQPALDADLDVIGLARPLCTEPDVPRRLISGASDAAKDESSCGLLGSGVVNAQSQTAWFYKQIIHLSRGGKPELALKARSALAQHLRREFAVARARRARRELPAAQPA